jgi:hypothetical protein
MMMRIGGGHHISVSAMSDDTGESVSLRSPKEESDRMPRGSGKKR